MQNAQFFKDNLFSINAQNFEEYALSLFRWQAEHNPVYKLYIENLSIRVEEVKRLEHIPFLPIAFFKDHKVVSIDETEKTESYTYYESSGTTGQQRSRHYLADTEFYLKVCRQIFETQYGKLEDFHVFALLPSYLERKHASLVAMADHFIQLSQSDLSGFYLNEYDRLLAQIQEAKKTGRKVLLLGVTFALLELAENYSPKLEGVIVMETGGMKGRRKEMIRQELHYILTNGFQLNHIHSEYGMTELLSQAYAHYKGLFQCPSWMRVLIRDINDPFCLDQSLRYGGINVIDLANVHSCAFIETQDLGRYHHETGYFEVLGRFDQSDVRGCNLMVAL
ncbi:acyl transferase [Porifericola rhodea]|uniref:acyl transferase n=1 Tax=Porifericola rhodea TaxID=930972 RepID=UPI002666EB5A|nr:acyl transferase [Porifericola rhodea]WKN32515.1 acyl transferase [Porifericola rhodea]